MARSGERHIVRNSLIGVAAFVVFIIVISEIVTHAGGSSKAAASSPAATAGAASASTGTLAPAPTTAEAACADIAVDPSLAVTHNLPKDEQGFAAVLAAKSTDRKTVTDAQALVTAIGTYLDQEASGAHLLDFTPQEDAVKDDCTQSFPNG